MTKLCNRTHKRIIQAILKNKMINLQSPSSLTITTTPLAPSNDNPTLKTLNPNGCASEKVFVTSTNHQVETISTITKIRIKIASLVESFISIPHIHSNHKEAYISYA